VVPAGYQGWLDADGFPLDEVPEGVPNAPLPSPAPAPAPTTAPAAAAAPTDGTPGMPTALPPPPPPFHLPLALPGLDHDVPGVPTGSSKFDVVIHELESAFPAHRRPPPARCLPANPHPADVLEAGFPTVPPANVPNALALTAFEEALAVTLPARQEQSPPWLETMADVGLHFPFSPAMPWAVAYACRLDNGGPASRARGRMCPYWTSPACRVTVYYSPQRLAHLSGAVLRIIPDPGHILQQRDAALRERTTHGCFTAHGLSVLFGRGLFAPGPEDSDLRPLWLVHVLLVTLHHFGQTVAMRAAPCDQHSPNMAADVVAVTHNLYQ